MLVLVKCYDIKLTSRGGGEVSLKIIEGSPAVLCQRDPLKMHLDGKTVMLNWTSLSVLSLMALR